MFKTIYYRDLDEIVGAPKTLLKTGQGSVSKNLPRNSDSKKIDISMLPKKILFENKRKIANSIRLKSQEITSKIKKNNQ